ncbi:hypothetical protein D9758_018641 [Tetrapyrgos nigripes]|uniref:SWIM-type domain-containing protein n=1 Tax=Tetrapyrgos nigripes TaxID=182062 RepID=A0A8H5BUQ0_9AGAR|nr:hypothetical protein D9758_018641 [Tetrapyrgos nigripes]
MAKCQSSEGKEAYSLELDQSGKALCTCWDFCRCGGACKHLRALQICLNGWLQRNAKPPFTYPALLSKALAIHDSEKDSAVSNLAGLQFLAQDMTTLGYKADLDEENNMKGAKETEAVEDNKGEVEEEAVVTMNFGNKEQWAAIDFQNTVILESEINSILPKLTRIDQALKDLPSLSSTETTDKFLDLLGSITTSMAALSAPMRASSPDYCSPRKCKPTSSLPTSPSRLTSIMPTPLPQPNSLSSQVQYNDQPIAFCAASRGKADTQAVEVVNSGISTTTLQDTAIMISGLQALTSTLQNSALGV